MAFLGLCLPENQSTYTEAIEVLLFLPVPLTVLCIIVVPQGMCLLGPQGSGSQLATRSLDLVRPRPGLHPGDLTLRPDADAVHLARQRMAHSAHQAPLDSPSPPTNADGGVSSGES